MTCDRFLLILDELDNEVLPPEMAAHMHSCPACSREVALLGKALGLYRQPEIVTDTDLATRVLNRVAVLPVPRRSVSMRDWLFTGVVILLSVALLPMLAGFRELRAMLGSDFTLPLALVFGMAVTLYAGLFVISHLDDFSAMYRGYETTRSGRAA